MVYTIRKTDSSTLAVINDDTVDNTSSSLSLVGKGIPNYGGIIAGDLIGLCENFAFTAPPEAPLDGQLWFNTNDEILCVQYNGVPVADVEPPDMVNYPTWHPLATRDWVANIVNAKTITLIGDVSGSGNSTIVATLATVNSNIGTFNNLTVNAKGLVTNASNINYALESDLLTEVTIRTENDATLYAEIASLTAVVDYLEHGITPIGGIILWSGALTAIPTYWHLCDGTNGTYDMRDKFIVGAGNSYTVGETGGILAQTAGTSVIGNHSHTSNTGGTILTIDEIPSHSHAGSNINVNISDPGHTHTIDIAQGAYTNTVNPLLGPGWGVDPAATTTAVAAVTGVTIANSSIYIAPQGSGASHSHTISEDGTHSHIVTPWDNRPPFLALAYIQRIS